MHEIKKNKNTSHILLKLFSIPCYAFPTKFSLINFSVPPTFLKTSRFAISIRQPFFWKNCFPKDEKEIDNFLLFKQRTRELLVSFSKKILTF